MWIIELWHVDRANLKPGSLLLFMGQNQKIQSHPTGNQSLYIYSTQAVDTIKHIKPPWPSQTEEYIDKLPNACFSQKILSNLLTFMPLTPLLEVSHNLLSSNHYLHYLCITLTFTPGLKWKKFSCKYISFHNLSAHQNLWWVPLMRLVGISKTKTLNHSFSFTLVFVSICSFIYQS